MQLAAIFIIGLVVVVVAIDAIARLDEHGRGPRDEDAPHEEGTITTQKIIVDLTKRH